MDPAISKGSRKREQDREGCFPLVVLRGTITVPVSVFGPSAGGRRGGQTAPGGAMEKMPTSDGQVEERKGPDKSA